MPDGFNDNLIWNIGHVIVAQQGLIYKSSNLPGYVSDEMFSLYRPGTKPTSDTSQDEAEELKELLAWLIGETKEDFYNGKFITFNERMTGTGFYLSSLTDAIAFKQLS